MAGNSMGTPSPAIFMAHISEPRSSTVMVVIVVVVMMMMGLGWGCHCQNGKGCASKDQFLQQSHGVLTSLITTFRWWKSGHWTGRAAALGI
jgi:hypothetical protein